jgi:apolipoprotein N-acyltransferase
MLAVGDFFARGDRTMTAQVPLGHAWTLYPRIGDLFAWSCLIALVVTMGLPVVARVPASLTAARHTWAAMHLPK